MGDPPQPRATSFSLPPGCRFYPSDEHLLSYYLTEKNNNAITDAVDDGTIHGSDLIKELDLFDYDPFELPDGASFSYGYGGRKRHWFCYTVRVLKESRGGGGGGGGGRRKNSKSGYWRKTGKARDVSSRGGIVLGTRTSFVFYLGNSPKTSVKTDWTVYQYALIDQPEALFVLCRIFVRGCGRNMILENGLNSCGEESVSAVVHASIQCNGLSGPVDARIPNGNSLDLTIKISRHVTDLDERIEVNNASVPDRGATLNDDVEDDLAIVEGDFLELDDLVD